MIKSSRADILQRVGRLSEEQAVLVVQIAKAQNRLFGGTEDFLVTREFRGIASEAQRRELLDCLFAVSGADDAIAAEEEAKIRPSRERPATTSSISRWYRSDHTRNRGRDRTITGAILGFAHACQFHQLVIRPRPATTD